MAETRRQREHEAVVGTVVFDYGGVLTTPVADSVAAWLERDGIRAESYKQAMRAWMGRSAPEGTPVHRLETGELDAEAFGALLAAELLTLDGTPVVGEGLLERLFAGMAPEPRMLDLVRELRSRGVRTVLLSNSWGNDYPADLDDLFDVTVISAQVGLRKPDPRVYRLTLERAGVSDPGTAAFVDDNAANVAAAESLGIHAIRHEDPALTRQALLGLLA